jgi:diguanylate cyclase (GGDEF)-like protein
MALTGSMERHPAVSLWVNRYGMTLSVLALLTWMWGLLLWFNGQQKQQLLVDRGDELALMADAVAQHSAGVLRTVESDLRTFDLWLMTNPDADPLRDPRFLLLVDEMRRSSHGLVDLRFVSASGKLYYVPSLDGKPRADVGDREYVTAHANEACVQSCPVHIGAPVLSRVTQQWDIPVSMRLSTSHGTHQDLRILFAAVSLARFAGEHERMRFQPDGTITLIRSDGIILSRAPLVDAYLGKDTSGSINYGREFGQKRVGTFISQGTLTDGVTRLVSYEHLPEYAVSVLVSRGLDDIYQTYYRRSRIALVLSAALSAVVLCFAAFLHRARRSQRALELRQGHLVRLATTDELTGVMNRRAFLEAARREFERAQRYSRPTSVLALDIDHFKRINDKYGHSGGDLALQVCTKRWQAALREHDLLGRIGGEEFCILLPETSEGSAASIAERMRTMTEATPVFGEQCVTVSIGRAALIPSDRNWAALMERADKALYDAKNQGRNCIRPSAPAAAAAAPEIRTKSVSLQLVKAPGDAAGT